ncbi:MAG: T9SS type A sorting domain-containing protein [Bacteroidetes bacterium]|nr:T9SS type A sorting domain-containing protein [Bacteroidota bacterium]
MSSTKNIEHWVLHNLNGQMERTDIVQNKNQFEIIGMPSGFYILTLVLEDGRKIIRKVVVV